MLSLNFSVLMLTYNQENYVDDAIKAILAQDCSAFEFIISDDCSSDATVERIHNAISDYAGPHRIVVNLNKKNLGITAHINKCIELCCGDVIIAAAGDDRSRHDRVRAIMKVYETETPLLVHSYVDAETLNSGLGTREFLDAEFFRSTDALAAACSKGLYIGATGAWHRDLFLKYGPLPNKDCYEDLILGFRAALENRVYFIDQELIEYRVNCGVSNKQKHINSLASWRNARMEMLLRSVTVLNERLRNARTFGLRDCHPIVRKIKGVIKEDQMRLNYYTMPMVDYLRASLKQPLTSLRMARSERIRNKEARF